MFVLSQFSHCHSTFVHALQSLMNERVSLLSFYSIIALYSEFRQYLKIFSPVLFFHHWLSTKVK